MRKTGAISALVLLLFLLVLNVPALLRPAVPTPDQVSPADTLDFDSYASGIHTILFRADGSIEYTLQAEEQIHYMNGITQLRSPLIQLYQDSGEHWNIVARSGRIQSLSNADQEYAETGKEDEFHIETIDLIDDVQVFQVDNTGNRMQMSTSFLSVDPTTETLTTDATVRLQGGGIDQTAEGLFADLTQNTIRFNAQVRGVYDPAR
ncbi:MAG: LPS export ABC transporter periplasmic protein LptC [Pseudomonadales bacterium]|nr:LPS export ABC transporter periplasmic protein LptC [Pseudomonadales bacterium]